VKYGAALLLVFTVLTAVMTYPQVLHLRNGVHDEGDPLLGAWIFAWVAHQVPRAPAHIFDANMFYPERRALALQETMLLPGIVAAPLHWIGFGPILVHNLIFLSGFIISGAGTAMLVRMLTGSAGAGWLAGIIFAFVPIRIDHYAHVQIQQTQCVPFAMIALHRVIESGRVRDGVLLGLLAAGQLLSCVYFGLFLIVYAAAVGGTLIIADWRLRIADFFSNFRFSRHSPRLHRNQPIKSAIRNPQSAMRRQLIALGVAGVVGTVAVLPAAIAYLRVREVVGERGREEVTIGSATWQSYLAAPAANVMYGKVSARFVRPERQLFPGFAAVVIAAIALWPPLSLVRVAYAAGLLVCIDVSLGFNGLTFRYLHEYVLPFRALRIPARMGMFTAFSLAVLGGFGAARLAARVRRPGTRRLVLGGLALLLLAEYASVPQVVDVDTEVPEAYPDLVRDRGDAPTAAIFEFPNSFFDNPAYLYYSTTHWQNLLNGYAGFYPPSYFRLAEAVVNFPDERSMMEIRRRGANYIVVHGERLRGNRYETLIAALDRRDDLKLVSRRPWFALGKHSTISVYRILPDTL